ncbi:MAG: ABC transporter permease [Pseudolabrys sp.]|nr:ABC transporter permease [Pseudolabrys sp.]
MTEIRGSTPYAEISAGQRAALALSDLREGLASWPVWLLLALNDIRQRYRRSRLGQFWLTLSMAVNVAAVGFVWSYLFKLPIATYMPFIATGMIMWALISTTFNEVSVAFIEARGYLSNSRIAKSTILFRVILRNLIIWLHNVIILAVVMIIFPPPQYWTVILLIPALLLFAINALWIGYVTATMSARFRDIPPILAALVQVAFFITPVMWRADQLPPHLWFITLLNPFSNFVSILREPLLGQVPDPMNYVMVILITLIGYAIAVPFFALYRPRIAYWL